MGFGGWWGCLISVVVELAFRPLQLVYGMHHSLRTIRLHG